MNDQETFGLWLKQRRKSLDLTRSELAARALCSPSTLRRLEADDLRPSRQLAETLACALKIPTDQIPSFIDFARGVARRFEPTAPVPDGRPPQKNCCHNLPAPLNSFVGRKQELAAVCTLLRQPGVRLLTLTGTPGTGKSRLSIAAALKLVESAALFPDGVYFVALSPLFDAGLVPTTIALALGLPESQSSGGSLAALKSHLRQLRALLVLDNFEQVIAAGPLITELLAAAPGIKALVTSRESLQVYGEHEFPVPPLAAPDVHHLPTTQALSFYDHFPAVQLFKDRAKAVRHDFHLTAENAGAVANICAWLDGLPLAIEMAATQMRWLSESQVLEQLKIKLIELTGGLRDLSPRQQSLQGAIEWSYDLLPAEDKRLFNWLGVFAGGFDAQAAQELAVQAGLAGSENIESRLHILASKSLLRYFHGQTPRFDMVEMLRAFARDRLQASGENPQARQAHAEIYYRMALSAAQVIDKGGDQQAWLGCLELEIHNLRAALAWTAESPLRTELALQFVNALFSFCSIRGYLIEGRRWYEAALQLDPTPTELRARAFNNAAYLVRLQGDLKTAVAFQEEALAIQKQIGDEAGLYRSLEILGIMAGMEGDYARAAALFEQVIPFRRRAENRASLLPTMNNLAIARQRLGDWDAAEGLYQEAVVISREIGNQKSLGHALYGLSQVKIAQADFPAALELCRQSLAVRSQLGSRPTVSVCFGALGQIYLSLGQPRQAALYMSVKKALNDELGVVLSELNLAEEEKILADIRAQLGEAEFSQAWDSARAQPLEEIIAFTLRQ